VLLLLCCQVPAIVKVNGQVWGWQDAVDVHKGSYLGVTRRWKEGDSVTLSLLHDYWLSPLPEQRPQFQGLKALMMGPFVMAGGCEGWLEGD
jgi:hypothetical protein